MFSSASRGCLTVSPGSRSLWFAISVSFTFVDEALLSSRLFAADSSELAVRAVTGNLTLINGWFTLFSLWSLDCNAGSLLFITSCLEAEVIELVVNSPLFAVESLLARFFTNLVLLEGVLASLGWVARVFSTFLSIVTFKRNLFASVLVGLSLFSLSDTLCFVALVFWLASELAFSVNWFAFWVRIWLNSARGGLLVTVSNFTSQRALVFQRVLETVVILFAELGALFVILLVGELASLNWVARVFGTWVLIVTDNLLSDALLAVRFNINNAFSGLALSGWYANLAAWWQAFWISHLDTSASSSLLAAVCFLALISKFKLLGPFCTVRLLLATWVLVVITSWESCIKGVDTSLLVVARINSTLVTIIAVLLLVLADKFVVAVIAADCILALGLLWALKLAVFFRAVKSILDCLASSGYIANSFLAVSNLVLLSPRLAVNVLLALCIWKTLLRWGIFVDTQSSFNIARILGTCLSVVTVDGFTFANSLSINLGALCSFTLVSWCTVNALGFWNTGWVFALVGDTLSEFLVTLDSEASLCALVSNGVLIAVEGGLAFSIMWALLRNGVLVDASNSLVTAIDGTFLSIITGFCLVRASCNSSLRVVVTDCIFAKVSRLASSLALLLLDTSSIIWETLLVAVCNWGVSALSSDGVASVEGTSLSIITVSGDTLTEVVSIPVNFTEWGFTRIVSNTLLLALSDGSAWLGLWNNLTCSELLVASCLQALLSEVTCKTESDTSTVAFAFSVNWALLRRSVGVDTSLNLIASINSTFLSIITLSGGTFTLEITVVILDTSCNFASIGRLAIDLAVLDLSLALLALCNSDTSSELLVANSLHASVIQVLCSCIVRAVSIVGTLASSLADFVNLVLKDTSELCITSIDSAIFVIVTDDWSSLAESISVRGFNALGGFACIVWLAVSLAGLKFALLSSGLGQADSLLKVAVCLQALSFQRSLLSPSNTVGIRVADRVSWAFFCINLVLATELLMASINGAGLEVVADLLGVDALVDSQVFVQNALCIIACIIRNARFSALGCTSLLVNNLAASGLLIANSLLALVCEVLCRCKCITVRVNVTWPGGAGVADLVVESVLALSGLGVASISGAQLSIVTLLCLVDASENWIAAILGACIVVITGLWDVEATLLRMADILGAFVVTRTLR